MLERAGYSPTPALDARVLLCRCAGITREYYYAHQDDHRLTSLQYENYLDALRKRLARVPVAYITGRREFMGLDFEVNPKVLIPRPATETLVDAALAFVGGEAAPKPAALDLGTGSGCIALSMVFYHPGLTVYGVDISKEALDVAQKNAEWLDRENPDKNILSRIHFLQGDLYGPVPRQLSGKFDLVVSNPPYVTKEEWQALMDGVRLYEPRGALVPDGGAAEIYSSVILGGVDYLRPGGALMVEIGSGQGAMVSTLFSGACYREVRIFQDLEGHDRVVTGKFPGGRRS